MVLMVTMVPIMVCSLNPLVQLEFVHQPAEDLHQATFAAEMQADLLLAPFRRQL
jgi:hypothetical protein